LPDPTVCSPDRGMGLGFTMRTARGPSKFWGYFRLVDACAQPGCAVCRCLREDSARYLDGLLYEHVNDPGTRARLHASGGFCRWHAAMVPAIRDAGFGTSILAEDLLRGVVAQARRAAARLERERPRRAWLRRLLDRRSVLERTWLGRHGAICPACAFARAAESRYLAVVLQFGGDSEFDRALERSDGLCVPHVVRLVATEPRAPTLPAVLQRCAARWERLRNTVEAFADKHDYRKREPITGEEALSWRLALEVLAGAPGVFGNDLHGPAARRTEAPLPSEPVAAETARSDADDGEALRFEKERLERRLTELTAQLGDASSRAAALHYRLWATLEDRRVLELNLAGERAAAGMWERTAADLRTQNEALRREYEALRDAAAPRVAGR